jgi:hypothetical protein
MQCRTLGILSEQSLKIHYTNGTSGVKKINFFDYLK